MAVTYTVGGVGECHVKCLSTDTKPTGQATTWTLAESDTGKFFNWSGSAWTCTSDISYALSVVQISAQPFGDQTLAANAWILADSTPFMIDAGSAVILPSGAILVLPCDAGDGTTDLYADSSHPTFSVHMFDSYYQVIGDQPLILDSGIVYDLEATSLLVLDPARGPDAYPANFLINMRPTGPVLIPDFSCLDVPSLYVLDAGVYVDLQAGATDGKNGGFALLNIST